MTHICFPKKGPETPFYSVFGVSAFWAKVSKKGNFEKPPKKRKIGLITEKLFFGIFVLFFFGGASFFPVFLFVFFVFLFFCSVFWFFLYKKTLFFPQKRTFLFIFSVSLSFSLSLFWPPSFSVSLCLSLFFLLFLLSSFLSFLFAFFWFLVFVSFFLFLSSLLLFHERNNIKILNCKFCLRQYFPFFCFPVFFVSSSFFLSLLFPDFKLCFLFNIKVFDFQTNNLQKKKHFFGQKGGLQQNLFLYQPVFWKM